MSLYAKKKMVVGLQNLNAVSIIQNMSKQLNYHSQLHAPTVAAYGTAKKTVIVNKSHRPTGRCFYEITPIALPRPNINNYIQMGGNLT